MSSVALDTSRVRRARIAVLGLGEVRSRGLAALRDSHERKIFVVGRRGWWGRGQVEPVRSSKLNLRAVTLSMGILVQDVKKVPRRVGVDDPGELSNSRRCTQVHISWHCVELLERQAHVHVGMQLRRRGSRSQHGSDRPTAGLMENRCRARTSRVSRRGCRESDNHVGRCSCGCCAVDVLEVGRDVPGVPMTFKPAIALLKEPEANTPSPETSNRSGSGRLRWSPRRPTEVRLVVPAAPRNVGQETIVPSHSTTEVTPVRKGPRSSPVASTRDSTPRPESLPWW